MGVLLSLQSLLGEPNKFVSPSFFPSYCNYFVHDTDEMEYNSASPLNGEAADLWDKDPEEFKRKVLARHRDLDEDDE